MRSNLWRERYVWFPVRPIDDVVFWPPVYLKPASSRRTMMVQKNTRESSMVQTTLTDRILQDALAELSSAIALTLLDRRYGGYDVLNNFSKLGGTCTAQAS